MKNIKEFEWIKVGGEHPCTVCERVNGECIADKLPIVNDEGSEISCIRNHYPKLRGTVYETNIN